MRKVTALALAACLAFFAPAAARAQTPMAAMPIAATLVAATPVAALAEGVATESAPTPSYARPATLALAAPPAGDGDQMLSPSLQRALMGTAIVGGAFALGFLATGSLSTALGAAGAVVLSYAVLP